MDDLNQTKFTNQEYGGIFDDEKTNMAEDQRDQYEVNPDFYRPSLSNKNVKGGSYEARIRFLINPKNKTKTKLMKWQYYLTDPSNPDRGFYVDCPSNVKGDPKAKNNLLSQAYFTLKDSDSKVKRDIAKRYFSRKQFFWTLVQVMIDKQDEEAEGKIKIFRFGKQINDKIVMASTDNPKLKKKGVKIESIFYGKDFILIINESETDDRSGGRITITSYDKSYFDDSISSISFDGGETRIDDSNKNQEKVFMWLNGLKKNPDFDSSQKIGESNPKYVKDPNNPGSPDLLQIEYHKWDDDLEKKIIESTKHIIADDTLFDSIYRKVYGYSYFRDGKNNAEDRSGKKVTDKPKSPKIVVDEESSGGGIDIGEAKTAKKSKKQKPADDDDDENQNGGEESDENGGEEPEENNGGDFDDIGKGLDDIDVSELDDMN